MTAPKNMIAVTRISGCIKPVPVDVIVCANSLVALIVLDALV